MGFGQIGFTEILILLVVVLLLFGAKRIPEIAGSFGKGITEFKRNLNDAQKAISDPPPRNDRTVGGSTPAADATVREEDRPEPKRLLS